MTVRLGININTRVINGTRRANYFLRAMVERCPANVDLTQVNIVTGGIPLEQVDTVGGKPVTYTEHQMPYWGERGVNVVIDFLPFFPDFLGFLLYYL